MKGIALAEGAGMTEREKSRGKVTKYEGKVKNYKLELPAIWGKQKSLVGGCPWEKGEKKKEKRKGEKDGNFKKPQGDRKKPVREKKK